MKTWRDVKWEYNGTGRVIARVDGEIKTICFVPFIPEGDLLGRAIAHAWNVDLAATRSWRELFGVDDSDVNVRDPAPPPHRC